MRCPDPRDLIPRRLPGEWGAHLRRINRIGSHESVSLRAHRHARDGMDDGQEAVEGHQDQRVDTRVARHHDHVLDLDRGGTRILM